MDENKNLPENIENETEIAQNSPETDENGAEKGGFFKNFFGGKKKDENPGPNLLLRIVIGVWLCYIAFQMLTGRNGSAEEMNAVFRIGVGLLFLGVGGFATINSLILFAKQKEDERAEKSREYAREHPDEFDEDGNYIDDDDYDDFDDDDEDDEDDDFDDDDE